MSRDAAVVWQGVASNVLIVSSYASLAGAYVQLERYLTTVIGYAAHWSRARPIHYGVIEPSTDLPS